MTESYSDHCVDGSLDVIGFRVHFRNIKMRPLTWFFYLYGEALENDTSEDAFFWAYFAAEWLKNHGAKVKVRPCYATYGLWDFIESHILARVGWFSYHHSDAAKEWRRKMVG